MYQSPVCKPVKYRPCQQLLRDLLARASSVPRGPSRIFSHARFGLMDNMWLKCGIHQTVFDSVHSVRPAGGRRYKSAAARPLYGQTHTFWRLPECTCVAHEQSNRSKCASMSAVTASATLPSLRRPHAFAIRDGRTRRPVVAGSPVRMHSARMRAGSVRRFDSPAVRASSQLESTEAGDTDADAVPATFRSVSANKDSAAAASTWRFICCRACARLYRCSSQRCLKRFAFPCHAG